MQIELFRVHRIFTSSIVILDQFKESVLTFVGEYHVGMPFLNDASYSP
jgi:hypothetical protein